MTDQHTADLDHVLTHHNRNGWCPRADCPLPGWAPDDVDQDDEAEPEPETPADDAAPRGARLTLRQTALTIWAAGVCMVLVGLFGASMADREPPVVHVHMPAPVAATVTVPTSVPAPEVTPVPEVPAEPTPAAEPAPMAPCLVEDGSTPGQAFPCVWDASEQGNGEGTDFVLTEPL